MRPCPRTAAAASCVGGRRGLPPQSQLALDVARISGGSSESVCGSTSAPSMPVDAAASDAGAGGAGAAAAVEARAPCAS